MILLFLLFGIGLPMLLGFCLGRWRSHWERRRMILFASLPFPALIAIPSLFLIVTTLLKPSSECGTDACGVAIGFGPMGPAGAALLTGVGIAMAWAGLALARRAPKANLSEPFE
jgi:hypothetical protein